MNIKDEQKNIEKINNIVEEYMLMMNKTIELKELNLDNLKSLFYQYEDRVLNYITEDLYDNRVLDYENLLYKFESIMHIQNEEIKKNISSEVIEKTLMFFNITADIVLKEISRIKSKYDFYSPKNQMSFIFHEELEKLLSKISILDEEDKNKDFSIECKKFVQQIFDTKIFVSRLLLEDKLEILAIILDSAYYQYLYFNEIPFDQKYIMVLPQLILEMKEHNLYLNNNGFQYRFKEYYSFVFQNNKQIELKNHEIQLLFQSLYIINKISSGVKEYEILLVIKDIYNILIQNDNYKNNKLVANYVKYISYKVVEESSNLLKAIEKIN